MLPYSPALPPAEHFGPLPRYGNYLLICGAAALCGFALGWDVGTAGNFVESPWFKAAYHVPPRLVGLVIATINIGCVCGCGVHAVAKRFLTSCKHLYVLFAVINLVGAALMALSCSFSPGLWVYIVARFITGMAMGAFCVVGPVLIGQYASLLKKNREFLLLLFSLVVCVLVILGNTYFAARGPAELIYVPQLCMALVLVVVLVCLPELPQGCIKNGKQFKVVENIGYFMRMEPSQSCDMVLEVLNTAPLDLPRTEKQQREWRKTTVWCCLVMVFQQLTGVNFFFYYGKSLFAGIGGFPNMPLVIMSLCNLGGTLVGCTIVALVGARRLLLCGLVLLASMLVAFSTMGLCGVKGMPMVLIVCVYIVFFASTWGPCAGVLNSQLAQNDAGAISWAIFTNWTVNAAVLTSTPPLIAAMGLALGFVFAGATAVSVGFVWWLKVPLWR